MRRMTSARAPGKLILSGEHAVAYGQPALAFAVDRYLTTTVSSQSPPEVMFDLVNLPHKGSRTLSALRRIANRAQQSFSRFQAGEAGIREVIRKPFELMEYTASKLIDRFNQSLEHGVKIRTESTIPTGSGMGSSAASIVSATRALSAYFNRELTEQERHSFHLETENLQHGRSSGIDLYLSYHGGMYYFTCNTQQPRPIWDTPLWVIDSGAPVCTTGECTTHVRQVFDKHPGLIKQFAKVTEQIDRAWQQQDLEALKQGVYANHQLLCQIGVVPESVQQLIDTLWQQGLAAKVCGAGAICGDKAGVALVIGGRPDHRQAQQIQIVEHGVELICA